MFRHQGQVCTVHGVHTFFAEVHDGVGVPGGRHSQRYRCSVTWIGQCRAQRPLVPRGVAPKSCTSLRLSLRLPDTVWQPTGRMFHFYKLTLCKAIHLSSRAIAKPFLIQIKLSVRFAQSQSHLLHHASAATKFVLFRHPENMS